MAYTLHIFRGTEWTDGADDPITPEELLAVEGVSEEVAEKEIKEELAEEKKDKE